MTEMLDRQISKKKTEKNRKVWQK